jgi:hypothetical protein
MHDRCVYPTSLPSIGYDPTSLVATTIHVKHPQCLVLILHNNANFLGTYVLELYILCSSGKRIKLCRIDSRNIEPASLPQCRLFMIVLDARTHNDGDTSVPYAGSQVQKPPDIAGRLASRKERDPVTVTHVRVTSLRSHIQVYACHCSVVPSKNGATGLLQQLNGPEIDGFDRANFEALVTLAYTSKNNIATLLRSGPRGCHVYPHMILLSDPFFPSTFSTSADIFHPCQSTNCFV